MKPIVLPAGLTSRDPLDYLCRADEQGLLLGPEESPEALADRAARLRKELAELVLPEPEVSDSVREDAGTITAALYGFRADWLPVCCSTAETGHFSAGVSVILDDFLPLVYLSGAFLKKKRHRGYNAEETLAHESVHAARIAFPDHSAYEEYFPCQVHASGFRRLAGNLFRRRRIAVLFFAGLILAPLCPPLLLLTLAILLTEIRLHRQIRAAGKKIEALGLRREPVLLRLSDGEIRELAAGKIPSCLSDGSSWRLRLFRRRFSLR